MSIAKRYVENAVLPLIEIYVDNINDLAERDMIRECEVWIKAIEGIRNFIGGNNNE